MKVLNACCTQQVFHPVLVEAVGAALAEGIAGIISLGYVQHIPKIHIENHTVLSGAQPAAGITQLGTPHEAIPHIFDPLKPGQVGHFPEAILAVIEANPGITQGSVFWQDVEIEFVG